ncbi:hypothetical protein [Sphingomonas turrisvirgatae]|uniref:Lipoprotein n=1 Tax=Sphingomonas turrisvirgatae TaxID=1888892 RepID=A0A1E3LUN7_9SPHN|nr:hypothetical protein [Sphingomonas turrisvirgatae]ODP36885.1 hypothetical protein BFL28_04030 [Sphingomonas turrisvirgatae]
MKHLAILTPLALLALTACEDKAAQQAAAEARAKAEATAQAKALSDALMVNVRCYAGIKWQQVPLQRGGIGDPQLYVDYYRGMIEKKLGDAAIPAAPPAPELSKATLDAYLDWAVKDYIDTRFTADRKGAIDTVSACVQSAAEFGTGPMAKLNPAQRFDKMEYLRDHLRQRGA